LDDQSQRLAVDGEVCATVGFIPRIWGDWRLEVRAAVRLDDLKNLAGSVNARVHSSQQFFLCHAGRCSPGVRYR
jgi:hypothetical protein